MRAGRLLYAISTSASALPAAPRSDECDVRPHLRNDSSVHGATQTGTAALRLYERLGFNPIADCGVYLFME